MLYSNNAGDLMFCLKCLFAIFVFFLHILMKIDALQYHRSSFISGNYPVEKCTRLTRLRDLPSDNLTQGLEKIFVYEANAPLVKQLNSRLSKLHSLTTEFGIDAYPEYDKDCDYQSNFNDILLKNELLEPGQETTTPIYKCQGRIKSIRNNGLFVDLIGCDNLRLQVMFRRDVTIKINDTDYNSGDIQKLLDMGDIIGVSGAVKKTKTGEITLIASEIKILSKCLLPLPDIWHGLKDVETRYRLRHLDILMNENVKRALVMRSDVIKSIRELLFSMKFMEVETPILQMVPSGASALPFSTTHNYLNTNVYLRIAPELFLKRLIIGGLSERVFEIGRCFRNEGVSLAHSPEFTMIEIYQTASSMEGMIKLLEDLISHVMIKCNINYRNSKNIAWKCRSMVDLIKDHTGIDVLDMSNDELLNYLNSEKVLEDDWGVIVDEIFKCKVEPHLVDPIHVTHLPLDISPLARRCDDNQRLSLRFESYINGIEIANGCTEECNPLEIVKRLKGNMIDEDRDFLNSMAYGMPPTAGLGIGIDRLVMILTESRSIKDVITFPLMKN